MSERVYLTRRNLLTLLSKLDRVAAGEESSCAIVKMDTAHEKYPCTRRIAVIAVEDGDYYTDRRPGDVHPKDLPTTH